MVINVAEMREARRIYIDTAAKRRSRAVRLPETLPPLGAMVEAPAAALCAAALAQAADFFAIGSNDLTMYTLAANRAETEVADLYNPVHPAVLQLIRMTVAEAGLAGIPVSICGEMAGNARFARLLLGMGLRSFSVSATAVPRVKQAVRTADLAACERLATAVLALSEPDAMAEILAQADALV